MSPDEFSAFADSIRARHESFGPMLDELSVAPADVDSFDPRSDALAEGLFLRAFASYEADIERMFLHYVTGGESRQGMVADTFLKITNEAAARKLTRREWKFLSWSKPDVIRETAKSYIQDGWPIVDMLSTRTQELADCGRVRNRIAHNSPEAIQEFAAVQINLLATERGFDLSPGQLLRIRHRRFRKLHITHYIDVMNEVLEAIIDPPP